MKLKEGEKYIIIARNEYHKFIYSFKKNNPNLDFKILTKEQFCNLDNFFVKQDAYAYLLKDEDYNYDYRTIKNILKKLNICNLEKDKNFLSIYSRLEKNDLIQKDLFFRLEKSNKKILIFEEKEDIELINYLNRNKISFDYIGFNDFNIEKNDLNKIDLILFDNKIYQYLYIFSDIRKKILVDKVNPNDISILANTQNDNFYIEYFSKLFNISIENNLTCNIRHNKDINDFIVESYKNRQFNLKNVNNKILIQIFNTYKLQELKNFDFAYLNLLEIIESINEVYKKTSGIVVTNKFDITNEYIYVTNFQYNIFYKVFNEKKPFNDELSKILEINTSYQDTLCDKNLKLNYLLYSKLSLLSRVISSGEEKIYDSQFIEDKSLFEKKEVYKQTESKYNLDGLYTSSAYKLLNNIEKDLYSYPSDKEYKNYSNKYNPISLNTLSYKNSINSPTSPSALKKYFSCPYSYYLDSLLKKYKGQSKDINEDNISNLLGDFVHILFRNIYTKQVEDFDDHFNNSLKVLEDEKQMSLSDKQKILFGLSKEYLHAFYLAARRQKEINIDIQDELGKGKDIEYQLDTFIVKSSNKKYYLKGNIDKIVHTSNYYTLIDYKTSSYDYFNYKLVFLGGSLQLPIYYLGYKNVDDKYSFGGFFIHNIFSKKPVKPKDNNKKIIDYFNRLNGLFLNDNSFIKSFDKNLLKVNGDIIGRSSNKKETYNFVEYKNYFDEQFIYPINKNTQYTFNDLITDAKNIIVENINNIENNKFDISPKTENDIDKVSCKYCSYRDICYRKYDDIKVLINEINNKFKIDDKEDEEETDD